MLKKSTRRRVVFSLTTITLVIVIAEGGLRLAGVDRNPYNQFMLGITGERFAEFDEHRFWRYQYSPEEPLRMRAPGDLGVLVLSDSVGMLSGYPQAMFDALAREAPSRKVAGANASVTGYTSFQGVRYFERELAGLRPEVVVINYGWNDHWRAHNGIPDKEQRPPSSAATGLAASSRLLGLLSWGLISLRKGSYDASPGEAGRLRVELKDYEANLMKLVRGVRAYGGVPVLVTAPYLHAPEEVDWIPVHLQYNAVVRRVARREALPLLDMVEHLKHRAELFLGPPERKDFVHYNDAAGKMVAQRLAKVILAALGQRQLEGRQAAPPAPGAQPR